MRQLAQLYLLFCMLACSGAGPGLGGGPPGGGSGSELTENSLDSKTNPNHPALAAAQPVAIGQPGPGPDPGKQGFFVQQGGVTPECKDVEKDLVRTKFDGFVRIFNPDEVPEAYVDVLSMGSVRVVDILEGRFTDLPLGAKIIYPEGVKKWAFGYFEFTLWSKGSYHFQLYLIPPKSTVPVATPWTSCPASGGCAPESGNKINAKTNSGDLEGELPNDKPLVSCPTVDDLAKRDPSGSAWGDIPHGKTPQT